MAWPQGLWALGLLWFAACAVILFGVAAYGLARRRYDDIRRIFGVASVEEEIDLSVETARADDGLPAGTPEAGR